MFFRASRFSFFWLFFTVYLSDLEICLDPWSGRRGAVQVRRILSYFFKEESWTNLSDSLKVTLADFRKYLLELEFWEAPSYADPFLPDLPDDLP